MAYKPETLVVGLGLTAIGILWTLGNLGRIDFLATLRTWWPLSLVVWGLLELGLVVGRRTGGSR